jgi:hypothetical protein
MEHIYMERNYRYYESHDIIIFVETKLDDLDILYVPSGYSYITKDKTKCVKSQVV